LSSKIEAKPDDAGKTLLQGFWGLCTPVHLRMTEESPKL